MDNEKHFLLIDDEGEEVQKYLKKEFNFNVHLITDFDKNKVFDTLETNPKISVILLDLYGNGESPEYTIKPAGLSLLESIKNDTRWTEEWGKKVLVVIVTKHPTTATRYKAAKWYLEKYIERGRLFDEKMLNQIWERSQTIRKLGLIPPHLREGELIFDPDTVELRVILENVRKVARFDVPILIRGETGCGKDLLAKAIFEEIKRQSTINKGTGGFTPFNICQVQPTLLRSELFGYLRDSFTGASPKGHKGIFQVADEKRHTLFLDEIGDAPLDVQVSFLRVLEKGEIVPIGATEPGFVNDRGELDPHRKIENIRLIFATHRPLEDLIKENKFREDLFHRINIFPINISPLRERKKDIRILAEHFRQEFNKINGLNLDFPDDEDFFKNLEYYDWPGNVRELKNALLKSFIVSCENPDNKIRLADDVRAKLTGQRIHNYSNIVDSYNFFSQLPNNPTTLSDIAKERGGPFAVEVGKHLIKNLGRMPNDEESQKYFGMKSNTFKKWMFYKGVTLKTLGIKKRNRRK